MELEFLVPFYGTASYLTRAIDAVRALEGTRWHVTIVEDADPDGPATQEKIEALRDDRITYLRNDMNLGASTNIYQCAQLAEWDYCVILDPDDLVLPNYGRAVAALLDRFPGAAMLQPGAELIDTAACRQAQPDRVKSWLRPGGADAVELRGQDAAVSLLRGNWMHAPATCYRRDALQKAPYREGISATHDLVSVIDILLGGESLVTGGEIAYQYHHRRASHPESPRGDRRFGQERRYFTEIAHEFRARGWHAAERAARLRLTSRLDATAHLADALRTRDTATIARLLEHAVTN